MLLGLAGDTMLGRKVAERIREDGPHGLFGAGVLEAAAEADVLVCNLECCISDRGERWPDPRKAFFFRAPPQAVETLHELGVDAVTLANNHALDFGAEALLHTVDLLDEAAIAHVGAGPDPAAAWEPAVLDTDDRRLGIVGFTDHPEDFAAAHDHPGTAYAPLRDGLPDGARDVIDGLDADVVLVTPHWGPNMTTEPVGHVRRAAGELATTGATLVAGHSAHAFHGAARVGPRADGRGSSADGRDDGLPVLFDLGDLIDDYAVDRTARNDLGLLWFVDVDVDEGDVAEGDVDEGDVAEGDVDVDEVNGSHVDDGDARVREVSAVPLVLEYRHTRRATGGEVDEVERLLRGRCRALGTELARAGDRLRVRLGA